MRRVSILTGIKQRLNEILGTAETGNGNLTAWSIQSAMLSNFNRVLKAINCNSIYGRRLSGVFVSNPDNEHINIEAGYAVTGSGNFISFPGVSFYSVMVPEGTTRYLCLLYSIRQMNDGADGAKKTGIINAPGEHQIVFDEIGACGVSMSEITSMISLETSVPNVNSNKAMIAVLTKTNGVLSVTNLNAVFTPLP